MEIKKNIQKDLNGLTDYDIVELYIKCVSAFVDKCSKYDLNIQVPFTLGQQLWNESIEILKEYRKEHSD